LKVSGLAKKWKYFESFEVGKKWKFIESFGVGKKMKFFGKFRGWQKNGYILKGSRLAKK
jgi:hypothetical protein